jgi:MYXO-CTERM domain-containing protein
MALIAAAVAMLYGIPARAATVIDLTTANATSGIKVSANGQNFIATQVPDQSTGTGVIEPFLRIQGNGGNEQGYNTSLTTEFDTKAGTWTHAITLADIPVVSLSGVDYREFLLDINQTNSNPLLSLNQIQIWARTGDPGNTNDSFSSTAGAGTNAVISFTGGTPTEVFRLSAPSTAAANAYEIRLNFDLNPGSGSGDMKFYVANSAFTGLDPTTNLILFTQFGSEPGPNPSNDGFEEWAVIRGGTAIVPEPSTFALGLGAIGLVGLAGLRRRRDV